jgi:alkyl sulfatase BDS1-like metallo-beta-lactamase superfamily hydrolase
MGRRMLKGLAVVLAAGCCSGGSAAFAQTAAARAADPASATTRAVNEAARAAAPFQDRRDYDFAARGFVATRKDPLIRAADGRVVWDLNTFSFVEAPAPDTVNPSLWRHAQVLSRAGLFKVSDRIWQVRGFDIANVTFVKGDKGWIVIDPLTADETARAAYDLVTEQLGKRPVSAIIYTHSHIDHFGGAGGILPFAVPDVPILAPQGFTDAAVGENVIAGPAMARRAIYQFGLTLPKGPTGNMGSGIGMAVAPGTQGLVPPNREIAKTGTEIVLDGVKLRFQVTPGTEAPAEMNIGFPDWKVADLAENANVTQHNILTPRGAVVRNAKAWAQGLTEAIDFFAGADVMITSHGWPRFGAAEITDFLGKHRDAYAYLHDQTVRLMNQGLTGDEIAAKLTLPKALQQEWYDRPYYGSLSFNARAVYQFYMGWYDGNPVHLAPLPPEEGGRRYVEALGGAARVRQLAQAAYDKGDYAWAAELLNRAVFADAGDTAARDLLARCYQQLAWQSENSLWRNMYLTGASELRGAQPPAASAISPGIAGSLTPDQLFDVLSVRFAAEKAGDAKLRLAFVFPDRNAQVTVTVANGVLIHRPGVVGTPDATLTIKYADLVAALLRGQPLAPKIASGEARIEGRMAAFAQLVSWIDKPTPPFAIVTP